MYNFLDWLLHLLKLEAYFTPIELLLLIFGFAFWMAVYVIVIKNSRTLGFMEIPFFVECADIAWEFCFSFNTDLGMPPIIRHGCQLWFALDCIIFYYFIKLGKGDLLTPALKRFFIPMAIFWVIFWYYFSYYFAKQGYDNEIGGVSALLINVGISATYIFQFVRMKSIANLSYAVAWFKMLGTGAIIAVCFMKWYDNKLLLVMCCAVVILDVLYVAIFTERWLEEKAGKNLINLYN